MQVHWWYAKTEQKLGPVALEIIQQKLFQQEINATTLVWREGLASWLPLGEVDELVALLKAVPPELPQLAKAAKAAKAPEARQLPADPALPAAALADTEAKAQPAAPWKRVLARCIDVSVLTFVLGFVLSYIAVYFAKNGSELAMLWLAPGKELTQMVVLLPLVLLLECLVFVGFGNTLGKTVLGLQLKTLQGGGLSFEQYFKRLCGVWWYGLGLGLPIINLITFGFWLSRLNGKGSTRYDENLFVVTQGAHTENSSPQLLFPLCESTKYSVIANGAEVLDNETGLVWQRCSVGQIWDGNTCVGQPKSFSFDEAQKLAVDGWRVPTVRELAGLLSSSNGRARVMVDVNDGRGLIASGCLGQYAKPTINQTLFPITASARYWTSSPYVGYSVSAWYVNFGYGYVGNSYRSYNYYVRLVRASQ